MMTRIVSGFRPLRLLLTWRFWLPSLTLVLGGMLCFSVILAPTALGRQVISTLRFALGWHQIARQQQQLLQAVEVDLRVAGLRVEVDRGGIVSSQRRGQEYWHFQVYTVQVPRTASLGVYETVLRQTIHRLRHTILRRRKYLSATQTNVAITVGIAGVPASAFVFTQPRSSTTGPSSQGQVAIVIDDLGWNLEAAHALLTLGVPLSFAILPDAPYRMRIAQEAQRRGYDVLLHLPMEPRRYPDVNPGHPVLLSTMKPGQLTAQIDTALDALPVAVGVNNHMGSRLTENRAVMRTVMEQMKQRHLFFLDSRTTKHSLAYQVAREMGVPTAQRHVFLDHEIDTPKIHRQLRHLATLAYIHGSAIGIGHPYSQTVRALRQAVPEFRENGIEIVPVSRLVR